MNHIKRFDEFRLNENAPSPVAPPKPKTAPPIIKPVKPMEPKRPDRIERPSVEPHPKAKKVSEKDVAKRFIDEVNKNADSIKKYLKRK